FFFGAERHAQADPVAVRAGVHDEAAAPALLRHRRRLAAGWSTRAHARRTEVGSARRAIGRAAQISAGRPRAWRGRHEEAAHRGRELEPLAGDLRAAVVEEKKIHAVR